MLVLFVAPGVVAYLVMLGAIAALALVALLVGLVDDDDLDR